MFNIRKGNQYYDYRCYMNNDANGRYNDYHVEDSLKVQYG